MRASPGQARPVIVALRRALFGVGPAATGRALVRRLLHRDPAGTQPGGGQPPRTHPFDEAHGTDTGGFRSWRELQTGGSNDPYISGYLGVTPSIGRRVIGLAEEPGEYAFVDLGCGKGRALILASERPFRRIVGVEIASDLAAAARENARLIGMSHPGRPGIEVVQADAASLELPSGPLALFLFQPFERPVMRAVTAALTASLAQSPRPAVVIYVHPILKQEFDRLPMLERAAEGALEPAEEERPYSYGGRGSKEDFIIWRTRAPRPSVGRLE